jgi:iron complex outermembrane receptor protein
MKAFRFFCCFLLGLLAALVPGYAQTLAPARPAGEVSGLVRDAATGQPVEFASVALLRAADAGVVQATYTDAAGRYALGPVPAGAYTLAVSFVGYAPGTVAAFAVAAGQPVLLGPVALQPQAKALGEVVVRGQRAAVEQQLDRTVLNVGALASNAGATALDILEKAPGVSVDQSGQLSLKGKKEVIVLIDGQRTYLSGEELASRLRAMDATQLSQVEIMTNPSAKYDAAGDAGVINLKTKQLNQDGLNGTLTLGVGLSPYFKSNDGLAMNYRAGQLNAFASYGLIQNNGSFDISTQRNFVAADGMKTGELNQAAHRLSHSQTHTLKLGLDYALSAATTLGFSASGFLNPQRPTSTTTTTLADAAGVPTATLLTTSQTRAEWDNAALNLNGRHAFGGERALTASADYLAYRSSNAQTLLSNTYSPDGTLTGQRPLRGDIPLRINIYTAQADYSQPVGLLFKLETGAKTAFIQTSNQGNYFTQANGVEQPDYARSNRFDYRENINAAYLNGSRQWGPWSAQLGLRYENTQYTGHQLGNPEKPDSSFVRQYNNLFPTVFLSYKASEKNQFAFSFGRRIDRPAYQSLNPFLSIIDQYTYSTGNPFLRPQFSTNLELAHTYAGWLTTTLNYSRTNGFITETLQKQGDVIIRSVGNVARRDNAGLALSAQLPINNVWTVNAFANGNYTRFDGAVAGAPFAASAFSLSLNLTNQLALGHGWSGEVSGFYHGRNRDEGQAVVRSISQLSLGLSKQLLDKRATLTFNVRDVLHSQVSREIQDFPGVVSTVQLTRDTRVANVSFVYRFGQAAGKGPAKRPASSADDEKDRVKTN